MQNKKGAAKGGSGGARKSTGKLKDLMKSFSGNRKIAGDLIYTVGATVVMNGVLQFIVYPLITRYFGNEVTGDILYFIGIIYIIPQAVGTAINNGRLVMRKSCETTNGDYTRLLSLFCALSAILCGAIGFLDTSDIVLFSENTVLSGDSVFSGDIVFSACFALFSVIYALRMYAQVEFRLKLKFSGYFWYNALVSAGYLAGLGLYFLTGQWLLIFVVGEAAALIYSYFRGDIFKKEAKTGRQGRINKTIWMLMLSTFIRDGVTQFDKVVVRQTIDANAVTEYHVVSLIAKTMQMLVNPINTLILSYLTVKDSVLNRKTFNKFVLCGLGIGAVFYGLCVVGTPIYIKLFYADMYDKIIQYNWFVNLGLVLGFVASLFMVVLLSQGKTAHYTVIQSVWGAVYIVASYILTIKFGLWGMVIATLVTNIAKLIAVLLVCYKTLFKGETSLINNE